MTRKYTRRTIDAAAVSAVALAFFRDEPDPDNLWGTAELLEAHRLEFEDDYARPIWNACREGLLKEWATAHPGTRPTAWWRLDAPGDRPLHESEAAFLRRHALLLPGESRRLTRQDFEPETEAPDHGD